MFRLIYFELKKIWCKRSFIFSICLLLMINIFFLWYTNIENEDRIALSSYKKFGEEIANMDEFQKGEYIEKVKRDIDGVSFVMNIISMQNTEMGAEFAKQEMQEQPKLFETYYDLYKSGNYLHFTNSFEKEQKFINEVYDEYTKVSNYDLYLKEIREKENALDGISVFKNQNGNENDFSSRNIKKSTSDYEKLDNNGICYISSKMITSTMENIWTDIFVILLAFLFIGSLITEEKEKGLFYITRTTKYGISHSIITKLIALFISCILFEVIFFLSNYMFFGISTGFSDISMKLQSISPYIGSNLSISILGYILISIITKSFILFGLCTAITAFCILSDSMLLPYLYGIISLVVSWILYTIIPNVSKFEILKHLNLFGLFRTESLYGTYLNLNFFGYPISRIVLSWIMIVALMLIGVVLCYRFFLKGKNLQLKQKKSRMIGLKFKPHSNLFRHEMYKTLITNHGFIIILLFSILIGFNELNHSYHPSVQEQYYQNIMLKLEGEQTDEKISIIEKEKARYEEAFEEIEKIDELVSKGEINSETGEKMKVKWYSVTSFYPAFQKVEEQYKHVCESGGKYIYDTGYLYLFGIMEDGIINDFLLLTLGIILVFSNFFSMEYQNETWKLLKATKKGKRGVLKSKVVVCIVLATLFSILPFICRWVSISKVFPLNALLSSVQNIPVYQNLHFNLNILLFILLKILLQILISIIMAMVVLVFSGWRKNNIQAIFLGILILCVPLVLTILGFDFMKYFSLYPLFSYTFT